MRAIQVEAYGNPSDVVKEVDCPGSRTDDRLASRNYEAPPMLSPLQSDNVRLHDRTVGPQ